MMLIVLMKILWILQVPTCTDLYWYVQLLFQFVSSQSSKDCGSLALKIGMSFMKCWFSWELHDLIIFWQWISCLPVKTLGTLCQFCFISK